MWRNKNVIKKIKKSMVFSWRIKTENNIIYMIININYLVKYVVIV